MANPSQPAGSSPADFEALARQYWNAWGETLRSGAAGDAAEAGLDAWREGLGWWTQQVHGGRAEANAAVERFNALARDWFGQMQGVAAQFAGKDASAADIAAAWKQALGAAGENPFPEMFRAMRGRGQQGLDQWLEDASPFLEAWKREGLSWLRMPAFGFARERQERWQALVAAQLDYQERSAAYNALMGKAAQRAFEVFEEKLAARTSPESRLKSARALFELWIDAAEEAYAEIALSPEFGAVYGTLVDAQMRVRAAVQKEVEEVASQLGMPTRTEVDAAHRRIAELERQVRKLRDGMAASSTTHAPGASATATATGGKAMNIRAKPDDGSNKLVGDPITGPLRGVAAPGKRTGRQAPPLKEGPEPAVTGKPGRKTAGKTAPKKPTTGKTTARAGKTTPAKNAKAAHATGKRTPGGRR